MRRSEPRVKLTYEDFVRFPDDGKRHELIDGEHYVTPSPNTKHQVVSGNLFFLLRRWLEHHPAGRVFSAPYDIVFTAVDVVEPDLLYFSTERYTKVITPQHAVGAPDLVVEIGSSSTRLRDETIKRRLYKRSGVTSTGSSTPTGTSFASTVAPARGLSRRSSSALTRQTCSPHPCCRASRCRSRASSPCKPCKPCKH